MSGFSVTTAEVARMQTASDWLQRLQTSPQDEALLNEWLDWCNAAPENLAAFERMQTIWQAFDAPAFSAPRVRKKTMMKAPSRLAMAAAIASIAILAAGWIVLSRDSGVRTLTTDVAEHGSQILSDGSHVDLGARTRIATRYTDAERTVTVEAGEAFFDVAKDAKRPFVVQAGDVRITALGTAFSVRRTLDRTTVTVSEGLVSVAPVSAAQGRAAPSHEVRAAAGERVTFSAADDRISIATADPKSATAWRQGVLRFVDEPLEAVIDDVNRYAPHRIVLTDEHLRARLYTGTIYRERIDDWLRALERVYPLEAVQGSSGEIVLAPKN